MDTGMGSNTREIILERVAQFLGEAGRRRVWRSAFAYAAVVFVALQLGEIVFPAFGVPDWAMRLLVVASFLGFPIVLALAWAFDITPSGIQRAPSGTGAEERSEYSGTTLPRMALLAVIVATVGGVGWWTVEDTLRAQTTVPGSGGGTDGLMAASAADDPSFQIRSLAVLPLEDFSEEEGGEYFTAGLHEELVSQLSQIGAARVISRTSVVQYDASGKAMPEIAADLGVEGVVEGSVFRDGDRVRITVQLIHGPTDQHLWANSYNGTLEDAIGLQRTVAQAIAGEIQAELFPEKKWETPETRIAASPRVQEEYLKGRYAQSRATPEGLESAVEHFEAAVGEDSSFAPAQAGLAGARFLLQVQARDSLSRQALADPDIVEPLQKALTLDGESPEAKAVYLTIRESLGDIPGVTLPEGFEAFGDSASLLEAEIALTATEYGRQLHRLVVRPGLQPGAHPPGDRTRHLADARRMEAASDYQTAEELIRLVIEEAPESEEAWDALERLRAVQGGFEAVAQVYRERLAESRTEEDAQRSVAELDKQLAQRGEEGFWSWRVKMLEERRDQGKTISPVVLARAYLGSSRTEEALRELEAAVEKKDRNLVSLWSDPAWDALRGDPRFRKILVDARSAGEEDGPDPGAGS